MEKATIKNGGIIINEGEMWIGGADPVGNMIGPGILWDGDLWLVDKNGYRTPFMDLVQKITKSVYVDMESPIQPEEFEEIVFPEPTRRYEGKCPKCGQYKLEFGNIPCPEGKEGCLVLHTGYRCEGCGRYFQPKRKEAS